MLAQGLEMDAEYDAIAQAAKGGAKGQKGQAPQDPGKGGNKGGGEKGKGAAAPLPVHQQIMQAHAKGAKGVGGKGVGGKAQGLPAGGKGAGGVPPNVAAPGQQQAAGGGVPGQHQQAQPVAAPGVPAQGGAQQQQGANHQQQQGGKGNAAGVGQQNPPQQQPVGVPAGGVQQQQGANNQPQGGGAPPGQQNAAPVQQQGGLGNAAGVGQQNPPQQQPVVAPAGAGVQQQQGVNNQQQGGGAPPVQQNAAHAGAQPPAGVPGAPLGQQNLPQNQQPPGVNNQPQGGGAPVGGVGQQNIPQNQQQGGGIPQLPAAGAGAQGVGAGHQGQHQQANQQQQQGAGAAAAGAGPQHQQQQQPVWGGNLPAAAPAAPPGMVDLLRYTMPAQPDGLTRTFDLPFAVMVPMGIVVGCEGHFAPNLMCAGIASLGFLTIGDVATHAMSIQTVASRDEFTENLLTAAAIAVTAARPGQIDQQLQDIFTKSMKNRLAEPISSWIAYYCQDIIGQDKTAAVDAYLSKKREEYRIHEEVKQEFKCEREGNISVTDARTKFDAYVSRMNISHTSVEFLSLPSLQSIKRLIELIVQKRMRRLPKTNVLVLLSAKNISSSIVDPEEFVSITQLKQYVACFEHAMKITRNLPDAYDLLGFTMAKVDRLQLEEYQEVSEVEAVSMIVKYINASLARWCSAGGNLDMAFSFINNLSKTWSILEARNSALEKKLEAATLKINAVLQQQSSPPSGAASSWQGRNHHQGGGGWERGDRSRSPRGGNGVFVSPWGRSDGRSEYGDSKAEKAQKLKDSAIDRAKRAKDCDQCNFPLSDHKMYWDQKLKGWRFWYCERNKPGSGLENPARLDSGPKGGGGGKAKGKGSPSGGRKAEARKPVVAAPADFRTAPSQIGKDGSYVYCHRCLGTTRECLSKHSTGTFCTNNQYLDASGKIKEEVKIPTGQYLGSRTPLPPNGTSFFISKNSGVKNYFQK